MLIGTKIHKKRGGNSGFTLIELVVIIVIIGILAAVAIPAFLNITEEAQIAQVHGVLGALRSAVHINHARDIAVAGNSVSYPVCTDTWTLMEEGQLPGNALLGRSGTDGTVCCDGSGGSVLVDSSFLAEVGSGTGDHCGNMAGAADWFYIQGDVYPAFPDDTYNVLDFV